MTAEQRESWTARQLNSLEAEQLGSWAAKMGLKSGKKFTLKTPAVISFNPTHICILKCPQKILNRFPTKNSVVNFIQPLR